MANKVQIEVFVCINQDGEYEVGTTAEQVRERFEENIGALADQDGMRIVRCWLKVPLPTIMEVQGEIEDGATAELTRIT